MTAAAGGPITSLMLTPEETRRYARHVVLRGIGGSGQQRLKAARVLVIGAGGLGSPVIAYLAAAGIGTLGVVDDDEVSLSNLQRQLVHRTEDIGRLKTDSAESFVAALNPHVVVAPHRMALSEANAAGLIADYDLVLDGTDDFATRFCVSDACVAHRKPLVSGALGRWTGQVGVFTGQPCYRCLVPEIPPDAETCAVVGVVGALAGVMGTLAALEAVKRITGAGETLQGRLLIFDGLSFESRIVKLAADPACPVCG